MLEMKKKINQERTEILEHLRKFSILIFIFFSLLMFTSIFATCFQCSQTGGDIYDSN
jgi:hypothetical protein